MQIPGNMSQTSVKVFTRNCIFIMVHLEPHLVCMQQGCSIMKVQVRQVVVIYMQWFNNQTCIKTKQRAHALTSDTAVAAAASAATALLGSVAGGWVADCDVSFCPITPFASSCVSNRFTSILPPGTNTHTAVSCKHFNTCLWHVELFLITSG